MSSPSSSPVTDPKDRPPEPSSPPVAPQTTDQASPILGASKVWDPSASRQSYISALNGSVSGISSPGQSWIPVGVSDIVPACSNGIKSLSLSKGFKEKLCKPWSHSVVVRLLGMTIGYSYLCHRLRSMWKPTGNIHIVDLDKSCFLVKFPHLPIHLYHGQVLTALGNLVGKTVKIDSITQTAERGKFSRIAVEIDLDKPLPPVVLLDGAIQQVEYENLPQLCFECGLVGHKRLSCPRRADPAAPETSVPAMSSAMAIGSPAPAPAADSYGPWMLVSRRSWRPAKVSGAAKEGTTATPRADNQAGSSKSFKAGESVQIPTITGPTIAKSVATGNEVLLVEPSGPGVKAKRKPKKRSKAKSADGLHQPSAGVKQAAIGPDSSAQDKLASVGPDAVMTPPPLSGLATQVGATSPQPSPSPEQRSPAATTPSQPGVAVELSVPSSAPAITSLTGAGGSQAIPDGPNGPADPRQTPLFANFCVPPAARAALSSDRSVTSAKFRRPRPEPAKTCLSLKPVAVVDRKSSSGLSKKPVKAKVVREALKITDPLAMSTAPVPVDLSVFLSPDGGPVNGATGDVEMILNEAYKPQVVAIFEPRGFSGGIWLLWSDADVRIKILGSSRQFIHALIEWDTNKACEATFVYASPAIQGRRPLWEDLRNLSVSVRKPWVIMGDFNAMIDSSEKQGGGAFNHSSAAEFRDCIRDCNLFDTGFSGPKFTWFRRKLKERLDRCLANADWVNLFSDSSTVHLERLKSDHRPILIRTSNDARPKDQGGLGLRKARELNQAYLMKLGWTILNSPDKLWVQLARDVELALKTPSTSSEIAWLKAGLQHKDFGLTFGIIIWILWKARNEAIFEDKLVTCDQLRLRVLYWIAGVRETMKADSQVASRGAPRRVEAHIGWKAGPQDCITINTDGSVLSPQSQAAAGGILRNNVGQPIHTFAAKLGRCSIM
ncbi:hypothetical protein LINPERHAP2_LOCUS33056 [Linum perenne]